MCSQQPYSNKACASFQPSKWLLQSIIPLLAIIGKHGLLLSWLLDFSNNSIEIDVSLFVETLLNHGPPLWFWDYQKNLLTRKCASLSFCNMSSSTTKVHKFKVIFCLQKSIIKNKWVFPKNSKLSSLQLK